MRELYAGVFSVFLGVSFAMYCISTDQGFFAETFDAMVAAATPSVKDGYFFRGVIESSSEHSLVVRATRGRLNGHLAFMANDATFLARRGEHGLDPISINDVAPGDVVLIRASTGDPLSLDALIVMNTEVL